MNFVADEGVERQIVDRLRRDGHNVLYIADSAPGDQDEKVLQHAANQQAVLITSDKDFGELVFRLRRASSGVMLLRLAGLSNEDKAEVVSATVAALFQELQRAFAVIEPESIRIRRIDR
jgi:predicted nuclease of predicted toxin-antitoxin system